MTFSGKPRPIFLFALNQGIFTLGTGKPSIEHSEHRKRPGWCGRGNRVEFKKRKISLDFFVSFFGDEKKKET